MCIWGGSRMFISDALNVFVCALVACCDAVYMFCFLSFFFLFFFFFSSRRRHTRSVSAFLLNRSSDLLGKIGVFHNRRNASSRLLLLISKHLILCIYLVFRILA